MWRMLSFPTTRPGADHSQNMTYKAWALRCCACLWCILAKQPDITSIFRLGSEEIFLFRTDLWRDTDVLSALLCSALHNGPWSAFRITWSYWFLWIQGAGLWLYSQPVCPSGCARKLDCWSGCWRKQICLSPDMQGTGRTSAQRCRCAKQWWHELRSNCPLLVHKGPAGSYCEEGGCKGEPSVTSLVGHVLFGLSTRKQPEKQGWVWQRLYMDTDPKKLSKVWPSSAFFFIMCSRQSLFCLPWF